MRLCCTVLIPATARIRRYSVSAWMRWASCTIFLTTPNGAPVRLAVPLVSDGGSWSEQLEHLDAAGYSTLISLPLSHRASELALQHAGQLGAMKPLAGKPAEATVLRPLGCQAAAAAFPPNGPPVAWPIQNP